MKKLIDYPDVAQQWHPTNNGDLLQIIGGICLILFMCMAGTGMGI